jgi:tetratricopeptide (TPR) repeat protein
MAKFEEKLLSLDGAGLFSGIFGLVFAAGDLVAAGDTLDDAIDCPELKSSAWDYASPEVCAAVEVLNASLEVLDNMDPPADTWEDYEAQFRVIQQDFEALQAADAETGGVYAAELEAFGNAMATFEEKLLSLGGGGLFDLMSELIGLALAAGDLAIAGDILDDAIDCPGVKGAILDSTEPAPPELCTIIEDVDATMDAIDRLDPDQFEIEEYYAIKLVLAIALRQNYEQMLAVGGELYPESFSNYEVAIVEYETSLEAINEGWTASRLWDHLLASGQLVIAKEMLGFAIDCPGT